nr:hypothetical protein [Tanacetum cinerariifolium]
MSAIANATPLVTNVTKPATNPRDADATPRINIQEFCEEYYEDILPIIMDKVHRDRRKDVHTRQSAFERLSETYLPSTTKSRPRGIDSRYRSQGRSRPYRLDTSNEDCPKDRERFRSKDGETIEDIMKRFKVKTGHMKGAPECMRISEFMHGLNNLELTKRLNEHVSKTMEEMMITTTAFIRGEAAASKKKGDTDYSIRAWINFMIVRSLSPYNGIVGRPGIREIQAVPSIAHRMLKFLVEGRIVTMRSIILIPTECTSVITSSSLSNEERTRSNNFKVTLHPDFPDQEVEIEGTLSEKERIELCSILKKNLDIFAWQPSDMKGVPGSVAEHQLNIREGYSPVQPKKGDCNPLSEIDWKVESFCGYLFKCFLDAYKGYHQIQVAESDKEKTTFHTGQGIQISRNIEVYNDELVVKSYTEAKMLRDIDETFRTRYFQAHPIMVVTDQPIKQIMSRLDVILADFLIEMPDKNPQAAPVAETQQEAWTLFTDGSSPSNNEAEYEALIASLRIAAQIRVQNVHVSVDSKLVANQVLGTYLSKEENMVKYLYKVKSLVRGFTNFSISQVPLSKNKKIDALRKIESTSFAHLSKHVLVEVLKDKSIKEKEVTTVVEVDGPTWMTPIVEYLKEGTLPSDRKKARKLRIKARQYELMKGILLLAVVPYAMVKMCWTASGASNGLVERANRSLGEGIMARLGERNKNCVEELIHVLWAHRIMIKSSHVDTPLSLTYGTEAVIPVEIGMSTYRTAAVDVVSNDEELWLNLNLLEEQRERAAIREAKAKLKMMKYYNVRVHGITFKPGDFVYHNNDASHAVAGGS